MQLFDVPPGWKSVPMWSVAARKDRKGYSDAELLSVYREYGVIRKSDRDDNHNVESEDLSNYKFVRKGDLVLNKMKTWQGSLGVSPYEGIVSPAYYVCELSKDLHAPYIHYLLRSAPYIAMYGARSKGIRIGQWDLPYEEFREIPVLVPPIEEQRRISDYLDRKLEVIDRLIIKKQDQIRNLREYFESSMLVEIFGENAKEIRNIHSSPSYNNSYLRFLDHETKISPFKDVFRFKKVQNQDPDPRILSLTKHGIVERDISKNEGQIAYSYDNYAVATIGDFVLNPMDLRAGSVAISNLTGVVSNAYFVFEIREMHKNVFDSKYCEYMLRSSYLKDIFYCHGTGLGRPEEGGGGRWTLSKETLSNFPFPTPSYEKQISIRKVLTSLEENYRSSLATIELVILKLKELKTSLITESVLRGSELK